MVFGQVHAGHAPNVIPTSAELAGTLRVRGRASWDSVQEIVESLVEATITPFGATYELDYQRGSPPVDNDPQATAVLRAATHAALGRDAGVPTQQSVGNEDFSWLLETGPRRLRAARCPPPWCAPVGRPARRRVRHRRGRHSRRGPAAGPHRARGTVGLRRVSPVRTDAFAYRLPEAAIAQTPLEPRDAARLLVARPTGPPEDRHVSDLPDLLAPGDLLVVNDTRVIPARLALTKATGGRAEVLLAERTGDRTWTALVKPGRRLPPGTVLAHGDEPVVEVGEVRSDGERLVRLLGDEEPLALLGRLGALPLPPYITIPLADPERYQTVFADRPGSAAAPTAGLHLTDGVLDRCRERGIALATVDLEVGLGTFAPIRTDDVEDHVVHSERYTVPAATVAAVEAAERVVAVGTTVVRTLETWAATGRTEGTTDLFIRRGHEFAKVDVLLTNFHVPRSSLLVLVDAFIGDRWRDLYATALDRGYRFLSFGDAMLLERG